MIVPFVFAAGPDFGGDVPEEGPDKNEILDDAETWSVGDDGNRWCVSTHQGPPLRVLDVYDTFPVGDK